MLFQSFACSHRSGISAAFPRSGRCCCLTAHKQTAWAKVRDPTSGLFCSCICFVFCGTRMVWTEPARNTGMVQLCPRLNHHLAPQCLMKLLLLSPSALLCENLFLRGSEFIFSFSHPDLTAIILLKRPTWELGLPHAAKATPLCHTLCWARGWGWIVPKTWQLFAHYHHWKSVF